MVVSALIVSPIFVLATYASAITKTVPWRDLPATPALVRASLPKPVKALPPPTNAPPCRAPMLRVQRVSGLQWSQNEGLEIRLRNSASRACLVRGTPSVVASADNLSNVVAHALTLNSALGEVANTPAGRYVYVDVSVPWSCPSNPGGDVAGLGTYHQLTINLGSVVSVKVTGLDLKLPCGLSVSPFFTPVPPVSYPTYWMARLNPRVSMPSSVTAGHALWYVVTLTNPLRRAIALSPCPFYVEHTSSNLKFEYRLNCATVQRIAAHGATSFQMRMSVPANTPRGALRVFWGLIGPTTVETSSSVRVN